MITYQGNWWRYCFSPSPPRRAFFSSPIASSKRRCSSAISSPVCTAVALGASASAGAAMPCSICWFWRRAWSSRRATLATQRAVTSPIRAARTQSRARGS